MIPSYVDTDIVIHSLLLSSEGPGYWSVHFLPNLEICIMV